MTKIFKLIPFFSERLWGGRELEKYGFNLPNSNLYGEAWVVSALDNGMTYLQDEKNNSVSLKEFFNKNKKLFDSNDRTFPLLSKIITANDNLSIQVHPDDKYGMKHNNMLGKPECWYILDCPKDAKMIYGHNANTKKELMDMVSEGKWDQILKKISIKKGDFLYVAPGKIHAITPKVTVFELQRSSDITYRFYDFDRKDKNGKLRELHLKESFDVTTIPDNDDKIIRIKEGILVDNNFFTLHLLKKDTVIDLTAIKWAQVTVTSGEIIIENVVIRAGESALITNINKKLILKVTGVALFSYKK